MDEIYKSRFLPILSTISAAFPSDTPDFSEEVLAAARSIKTIASIVSTSISDHGECQRIIQAIEALVLLHSDATKIVTNAPGPRSAARARVGRQRRGEKADIFLKGLVRVENQKAGRKKTPHELAGDVQERLSKALVAIGQKPLQLDAIRKRITRDKVRWAEEEAQERDVARRLEELIEQFRQRVSDDFMQPIRDMLKERGQED